MTTRGKDIAVSLVGAGAAGLAPNVAVVAFAGIGSMQGLFWAVVIPAELVLLGSILYARASGLERAFRHLWIGVVAGIALTIALDAVRYTGFRLGALPADMPLVFGNRILDRPMNAEGTALAYLLGYGYHFMNGVGFGTVFSVLFGRARWWLGVLYSVFFVEVGMMTLPPMAKMAGAFGIERYGTIWNEFFLTTLLAHVSMGLALGAIMQRWGRYPGLLFPEGRGEAVVEEAPAARAERLPGHRLDAFVAAALALCCGLTVLLLALGGAGVVGGIATGSAAFLVGGLIVVAVAFLWRARQIRRHA